jgi:hypothetical protein
MASSASLAWMTSKPAFSSVTAESIRNRNSSSTIRITGLKRTISIPSLFLKSWKLSFRSVGLTTYIRDARIQLDAALVSDIVVSDIVKTKRVSSGLDVTSICPPCACAICEAICSLRPRPGRLSGPRRERTVRKTRPQTRDRRGGAQPRGEHASDVAGPISADGEFFAARYALFCSLWN